MTNPITPTPEGEALEQMPPWREALEILVVHTAAMDAQVATECEAVLLSLLTEAAEALDVAETIDPLRMEGEGEALIAEARDVLRITPRNLDGTEYLWVRPDLIRRLADALASAPRPASSPADEGIALARRVSAGEVRAAAGEYLKHFSSAKDVIAVPPDKQELYAMTAAFRAIGLEVED